MSESDNDKENVFLRTYSSLKNRLSVEESSNLLTRNSIYTALVVLLFASLSANAYLLSQQGGQHSHSSPNFLSAEEIGSQTADFANSHILQPSPNNVSAEFVNATSATSEGLPNFYKVNLNVTNPSGSQVTSVYTRKDGTLVFLQMPRMMDDTEFDPDHYH